LKSDSCHLELPELDVEVGGGALCSRFTTVEGLLIATKEQLKEQSSFFMGDSAESSTSTGKKMDDLFTKIDEVLALKRKCTLVLDDPAGNSYLMSLNAPMEDSRLQKEFYKRSYEQNEELGLNDMKTENYEEMTTIEEGSEQEKEAGLTTS
jgi:zinc finger protein